MNFLKRLFHGAKPHYRSNPKTADEKAKARKERFLARLERLDPETYRQIMLQEIGHRLPKPEDTVTTTLKTLKELKAAGLIEDPRRAGQEGEWDWLKSIGAGVASVYLQSQLQAQQMASIQQAPVPASPPPLPTNGGRLAEPTAPVASLPQGRDGQTEAGQTEEDQPAMLTSIAIAELKSRSPEEAARWLLSLPVPALQGLLSQIAQTPDKQLPALLDNLARAYPGFAGLVEWLRANPQKFMQIVHALRSATGQPAPKASMGL